MSDQNGSQSSYLQRLVTDALTKIECDSLVSLTLPRRYRYCQYHLNRMSDMLILGQLVENVSTSSLAFVENKINPQKAIISNTF